MGNGATLAAEYIGGIGVVEVDGEIAAETKDDSAECIAFASMLNEAQSVI